MASIRAVALTVVRNGHRVLLVDRFTHGRASYRPVGGGIELGERATVAARRELREELGIECGELRLLGVLESIFTLEGPGHEIVFIFETDWPADAPCGDVVQGHEDDGTDFECRWHDAGELATLPHPLFPEGLLELLLGGT